MKNVHKTYKMKMTYISRINNAKRTIIKLGGFCMQNISDGWLPTGKIFYIILSKFADQTMGLR